MKLRNIRKTYHNRNNDVQALKGISLDLDTNGITVILGPSGCGKTTLMNIIAGRSDYEGTIENVPEYDYLTQQFNLFEDMTVMDNLLLVSDDMNDIDHYLNEFSLVDQKNRKVKKLSNGQKKRVQFIRALLHQPGLLLCDEPTAALDHDNAVLLMEEMKKLSDRIQIILVTHDILLSKQYADRIITMEQGVVIRDEIIHEKQESHAGNRMKKRNLKDTAVLSVKNMISRLPHTCSQILLSTISIFSLFVFCNLYGNVSKQSNYSETFANGENMIVSVPQQTTSSAGENISGYRVKYAGMTTEDLFSYDEIVQAVKDHPQIIAVEAFNSRQYVSDTDAYNDLEYQRMKMFDLNAYGAVSDDMSWAADRPVDSPVLIPSNSLSVTEAGERTYLYTELVKTSRIQVFDLANGYQDLPLICGSIPEDDSVIIDQNTADLIMKNEGYDSYEQLIGKTMILGTCYYRNQYEFTPQQLYEPIEVRIAAVAGIHNDLIRMVFFNKGIARNPLFATVVQDLQQVRLDYVRFIVQPGSDYAAIAESLDSFFHKPNVDVTVYQGKGLGKEHAFYQSPSGLLIYGIIVILIIGCMYIISEVFYRKRMIKEKNILHTYGYSPLMENVLRTSLIMILSCILSAVIAEPAGNLINEFASTHYYQPFMTFSLPLLLIVSLCTGVFMTVLERIIAGR